MYKRSPVGRPSAVSAVIEVRGILGDVVENLGVRIVGGEWGADVSMPREHDFVEELKVSRSAVSH